MIFWWDEDANTLRALFQFVNYKDPKATAKNLLAIFEQSHSVEIFLASDQKPVFIKYKGNMSRNDFKRMMGQAPESYDALGAGWRKYWESTDEYKDMFFGLPVNVVAYFARARFFSDKKLKMFTAHFEISCPSLEQAEAAGVKVIELAAGAMPDARGIGSFQIASFGRKSLHERWISMRTYGAFSTAGEYVRIAVRWNEEDECLLIGMVYQGEPMSEEYYKIVFENINENQSHVFYNVKP